MEITEQPLSLDMESFSAVKHGKSIYLTKLEFCFLDLLISHRGTVVTYEEIYHALWQKKLNMNYSIQARISNLAFLVRKKVEDAPQKPMLIKTIRSIGYMYDFE